MNLIRKYKLHKLTPCLNEEELKTITFIENKIKGLKLVKKKKYPESTFYVNYYDGTTILEQDDRDDRLRVMYVGFWELLERGYFLKSPEIKDIIQYMVWIHLKFRSSTPEYTIYFSDSCPKVSITLARYI